MKLPLDFVLDRVTPRPDASPAALAAAWTRAGIKVERIGPSGPQYPGVVVGQVRAAVPHPNADRLSLCTVALPATTLTIVCGAPNVAAGQTVAVATVGAVLPGGREIGRARIRGVASEGMICSESELGLGKESDGILVLPSDAPLGERLDVYLGHAAVEVVFEIAYNRADCLSALGVARELAAALGGLATASERLPAESGTPAASLVRVALPEPEICPHYVARVIEGVSVGPSPAWVRSLLVGCGLRPVNNVVDATNVLLMERGQPLHVFDLARIGGGAVSVRRARPGEGLTTLDRVERKLTRESVVVADADCAIALAGVMGGAAWEITAATRDVLVESAYFDPEAIRRSARTAGLRTEASIRFAGGADPAQASAAADAAAALIAELAGGRVARGRVEAGRAQHRRPAVSLRPHAMEAWTGVPTAQEDCARALRDFGFDVERSEGAILAVPPTWRHDVRCEADLIEEVSRRHGYERIPEASLPPLAAAPAGSVARLESFLRRFLSGAGLLEAQLPTFIASAWTGAANSLPAGIEGAPVRLSNPLAEDQGHLRWSLLPGLLSACAGNARRGERDPALFELGRTFRDGGARNPDRLERRAAAWMVCGRTGPRHWLSARRERGFYDAKGLVESAFETLGIHGVAFVPFQVSGDPYGLFSQHRSAEVRAGAVVLGVVGEVSAEARARFDLPEPAAAAELDVAAVAELALLEPTVQESPRHPPALRDLAVSVESSCPAARLLSIAREAGGRALAEASVFDVYSGPPLPAGRKSVAIALSFRAEDRSLTDSEVSSAVEAIVARMKERVGAEIRSAPGG